MKWNLVHQAEAVEACNLAGSNQGKALLVVVKDGAADDAVRHLQRGERKKRKKKERKKEKEGTKT